MPPLIIKVKLPHHPTVTHKLICPSSSCKASISSDKLPRAAAPLLGEGGARWGVLQFSVPLCRARTLSHSRGCLVFIKCSTLWTLALTEWLGLVDCHKKTQMIVNRNKWQGVNLKNISVVNIFSHLRIHTHRSSNERNSLGFGKALRNLDLCSYRFLKLGLLLNVMTKYNCFQVIV